MILIGVALCSTVEEKRERNENIRFMKNADPQDAAIVLGAYGNADNFNNCLLQLVVWADS